MQFEPRINDYLSRVAEGYYRFGRVVFYGLIGCFALLTLPIWGAILFVTLPFYWIGKK